MTSTNDKSLTHLRDHLGHLRLMRRPTLWIRTSAGPSIGFGHLRRSLILAGLLENEADSCFLVDQDDFFIRRDISEKGCKCIPYYPDQLWTGINPLPNLLLIDTRDSSGLSSLVAEARKRLIPVVSIHDLGLNPVFSDIGIDASVEPEFNKIGPASVLTGFKYMVLDPSFAAVNTSHKTINKNVQRIVINLGGGDSSRFFMKLLKGLLLCDREFEVIGIRGFVSWGQDQLNARDWQPLHFRWAEAPESIAELLSSADLAITAGGLSAFEALCAGTPLMALSYDPLQHQTVSALDKAGLCLDLQCGETFEPQRIPSLLLPLEKDLRLREIMSRGGRQLIDGRGAERVCAVIRQLMCERKLYAAGFIRSRGRTKMQNPDLARSRGCA
jgi:spore coat polysaccharide biosynthesis predicted glycosyltransferase SpsG